MSVASAGGAQTLPTTRLDPEDDVSFGGVAAAAPGVGFVAAWDRGRIVTGAFGHRSVVAEQAVVVWLGSDGTPLTSLSPLDSRDDEVLGALAVASAAPEEAVVALVAETDGVGRIETVAIELTGTVGTRHDIGACPAFHNPELLPVADGYWLLWTETCGEPARRARRIDRSGTPVGEVVSLEGAPDDPLRGFDGSEIPGGGFWTVWVDPGGQELLARRYLPGGTPATPIRPVRHRPLDDAQVAGLPGGAALVAWREAQTIMARLVTRDGGLPVPPATLGDPQRFAFLPRVAAAPAGVAAATWCRDAGLAPNETVLALLDVGSLRVADERIVEGDCSVSNDVVLDGGGNLLVLAHESVPTGALVLDATYDRPRIAALPAVELVPPPGSGFVPNAFPGFRFWVRIGGDEADPRLGQPELFCLPQTSCVSGAVAGRSEVLLRIVGPKPNGYLWPTVVRFTTSTVEIWVEQLGTGERRYYRSQGASPGVDELAGFFDRTGFLP